MLVGIWFLVLFMVGINGLVGDGGRRNGMRLMRLLLGVWGICGLEGDG
jgi:hypothetical protein